jgi:hypothetical protein
MGEFLTVGKLINLLIEVERRQAELGRERERLERRILEELLKRDDR